LIGIFIRHYVYSHFIVTVAKMPWALKLLTPPVPGSS
jgi:hypothetical protein